MPLERQTTPDEVWFILGQSLGRNHWIVPNEGLQLEWRMLSLLACLFKGKSPRQGTGCAHGSLESLCLRLLHWWWLLKGISLSCTI